MAKAESRVAKRTNGKVLKKDAPKKSRCNRAKAQGTGAHYHTLSKEEKANRALKQKIGGAAYAELKEKALEA